MDWNLILNGKPVQWRIADTLAFLPSLETPSPSPSLEPVTESPEAFIAEGLSKEEKDRKTFEQAGWRFREPSDPPDNVGGGPTLPSFPFPPPPDQTTRPVFISESGDVLIGSDVATVQLNAAATTDRRTAERVLAEDGLSIVYELSFAPHLYAVRLPKNRPLVEVIDTLQAKTHRYVFAEPSLLQRISGRQSPTDPQFSDQWQHASAMIDDETGGLGLHSVGAWEFTKGRVPPDGDPVRIAIIDTGMDIGHKDLEGAIVDGGFFRPDGLAVGTATFVRFHQGMDGFPDQGHGTFCMGMAGARANDGIGGCGIAPESHLIAIACAINKTGNQLTLARSIEFALDPKQVDPQGPAAPGADVISCSLGTANMVETVLELAINSATSGRNGLGVPIFWAVDNDHVPISNDKLCSLPNVIAVGSSNRMGHPRLNCAFGPELEFLAPGEEVLGPTSSGSVNRPNSGTSFATPLAAGVAALVISRHKEWTAQQVLQRLRDTCDRPNGQFRDDTSGFGRLNAHRAVQEPT